MSEKNKAILEEANVAVAEGNYERFLSFCADDTEWTVVGDNAKWITAQNIGINGGTA